MPDDKNEPVSTIECGTGYTWRFRESGWTGWFKRTTDTEDAGDDLVTKFTNDTQEAAAQWVKKVECKGNCQNKQPCTKGSIRIGPPITNGNRLTWVPQWDSKWEKTNIFVEVTTEATVICYCGHDEPKMKSGSTEVHPKARG